MDRDEALHENIHARLDAAEERRRPSPFPDLPGRLKLSPIDGSTDGSSCDVFINYRHDDEGWAAITVADALSQRLGRSRVFLDSRSIGLGQSFDETLMDGVRRSAVLIVMIGRRWSERPLLDRLADPEDWVRREILEARATDTRIIPVLVDRSHPLDEGLLPAELAFLAHLQHAQIQHAHHQRDLEALVAVVADLLAPGDPPCARPADMSGAERTRTAFDDLLRQILPAAQQGWGNRGRLVELALSLLTGADRLVYLAPARLDGRPNGSATVLVTGTDVVVADVDERFRVAGLIRFPRNTVVGVELIRRRRAGVLPTADAEIHTASGDVVVLLGLLREQGQQLVQHLRP
ncbi:MAG: toll/interleukin-1 receptor domain-containing protein [Pseudonocardiaceae bacterium]